MSNNNTIDGNFLGKDIVSIDQFTAGDILLLFTHVPRYAKLAQTHTPSNTLAGQVVTLLFYEPSSRTFGSFCSAAQRLGAGVLSIQNPQTVSAVAKGETLEDTIKTFASYSDAIVIRSKEVGVAMQAAKASEVPVFNAGDGIGEHPTQALLDLYTIYEKFGKLHDLTLVMAGDMLNGRTVHSLLRGLSLFKNNAIYLLSPKQLMLSREQKTHFHKSGLTLFEIFSDQDMPSNAHVWYWTRVQKERFASVEEYESLKHKFILTPKLLKAKGNKDLILMHPLPRVGEIEESVDTDPRAFYFTQMKNGLYVRMALFSMILSKNQ